MKTFFAVFLLVSNVRSRLHCYDTDMQDVECEPDHLWCLKWTNSTTTIRGCTDVSEFCYAAEAGCYKPGKGSSENYCCCQNKDLCNGVTSFDCFSVFFLLCYLHMFFY